MLQNLFLFFERNSELGPKIHGRDLVSGHKFIERLVFNQRRCLDEWIRIVWIDKESRDLLDVSGNPRNQAVDRYPDTSRATTTKSVTSINWTQSVNGVNLFYLPETGGQALGDRLLRHPTWIAWEFRRQKIDDSKVTLREDVLRYPADTL